MSDTPLYATVELPKDAHRPSFILHKQDDRDLVACKVGLEGWQSFERPLPDYFFRVARSFPGLVVDIGANTGFYTMLAASACSANTVLAFEPVPSILEILHQNVNRNDLQDRVRLIACAVSNVNGRAALFMPTEEHGLIETSASLEADFKSVHSNKHAVLVRTLDRVLFRPSLARKRVSLIKIDVEGHEAAALEGARWTIWRHRPIIFIEILPKANLDRVNRFLRRSRYKDVRLVPNGRPIVGDAAVFDDESWNHALVPRERVNWFCED